MLRYPLCATLRNRDTKQVSLLSIDDDGTVRWVGINNQGCIVDRKSAEYGCRDVRMASQDDAPWGLAPRSSPNILPVHEQLGGRECPKGQLTTLR